MEKSILRIGDAVNWRGGFGTDAPKPAKVTRIERTHSQDAKHGTPVECLSWDWIRNHGAVVDLDNGHWARGGQIAPLVEG